MPRSVPVRPAPRSASGLAYAVVLVALVVLLGLVGCMPGGGGRGSDGTGGAEGEPTGESASEPAGALTVLAAASLTESFDRLGESFTAQHPKVEVRFSYGSSSTLAAQVVNGAPADVFAAAHTTTMDTVTAAGLAVEPRNFATNVLQIAVPPGNPGGVTGLADFADERKTVAVCAPQVPCGSAAVKVFAAAGITPRPDSYERDVKAALTKVTLGEVDAALVYATDVRAAGARVEGIGFAAAAQAVNVYPITALTGSRNRAAADAFVAYVLSPKGQRVLRDSGFGSP